MATPSPKHNGRSRKISFSSYDMSLIGWPAIISPALHFSWDCVPLLPIDLGPLLGTVRAPLFLLSGQAKSWTDWHVFLIDWMRLFRARKRCPYAMFFRSFLWYFVWPVFQYYWAFFFPLYGLQLIPIYWVFFFTSYGLQLVPKYFECVEVF